MATSARGRPTETFPIPARAGIRFFRRVSHFRNIFREVARRSLELMATEVMPAVNKALAPHEAVA